MNWSQLPNAITILRFFFVLPVAYAQLHEHYWAALVMFTVAGLSDGLDGFLAKKFHWESRLGSLLDPLADKLLLVTVVVILAWQGHLPWWLFALVIARDIAIVSGAAAWHVLFGNVPMRPSWSSKINTVLQIMLVFVALLGLSWLPQIQFLLPYIILIVAASTVYSGAEYVLVWSGLARQRWRQNKHG